MCPCTPGDGRHLCAARPSDQGATSAAHLLPQHGAVRGTALVLLPRGLPPPQRAQLRAARHLSGWKGRQGRGTPQHGLVVSTVDTQARRQRPRPRSTGAQQQRRCQSIHNNAPAASTPGSWAQCTAWRASAAASTYACGAGRVGEHGTLSGIPTVEFRQWHPSECRAILYRFGQAELLQPRRLHAAMGAGSAQQRQHQRLHAPVLMLTGSTGNCRPA